MRRKRNLLQMIRPRQLLSSRMEQRPSREVMPSKRPKETTIVVVEETTAEAVVIIAEAEVTDAEAIGIIAEAGVVIIAETAKMKTDLSLKLVRNLSLADTTTEEEEEEIAVTTAEAAEVVAVTVITEVTDVEVAEATSKEDLKQPEGTKLKTTDNRCE